MKFDVEMRVKTLIKDAKTGRTVKERPWQKNLVLDQGLNGLAQQATIFTSLADSFLACRVGSGTNPVKISSGAITFTQAGTTLTASGGFFTAAMVGGLFKWGSGSGGAEIYITAFTSSTVVTVDTSATVAAPAVGVVWQVQAAALQTLVLSTATLQTASGDNGYTANGPTASTTFKRTFVFPVQGSPYTVNEIGWYKSTAGTNVYGRLLLSSSDVVATTNFYVVVLELTVTWSPGVPVAVADLGVNFNTAGTAAIEYFSCSQVSSADGSNTSRGSFGLFDANLIASPCGGALVARIGSTYTQNAEPGGVVSWGTVNVNYLVVDSGSSNLGRALTKVSAQRGRARWTFTGNLTTSGQTCYGIGIVGAFGGASAGNYQYPAFDIKLTTPQVLPVGSWQPTVTFDIVYGRTLVN